MYELIRIKLTIRKQPDVWRKWEGRRLLANGPGFESHWRNSYHFLSICFLIILHPIDIYSLSGLYEAGKGHADFIFVPSTLYMISFPRHKHLEGTTY